MALSPFQERVARLVAQELEGTDVALAGGAALIAAGLVDRQTRDLDFFGSPATHPAELVSSVTQKLEAEGLDVEVITNSTQFARIVEPCGQD
jgi:hypothetical protein